MRRSFRSLKKSVVNIAYLSTNKAFQILEDPSGLESPFNGMYEFLALFHILISPKLRIHTRIEMINLVLLNYIIQCLHNICQRTITEHVNHIELHDLPFIVTDREHNCTRRLNDGVVMLELEAFCIPSWFSEIQLFLVAFNAEVMIENELSLNSDMTWWTTERQRFADINPDLVTFWISPVNVISVTLFHLELKMNGVWVESFYNFICLAFKVCLSKLGMTQADFGVAGLSSSGIELEGASRVSDFFHADD
nr:hypothetical protein [Tanacetum cinerariifolium]